MSQENKTQDATVSVGSEAPLPKLSPQEFRIYNRLAEGMDYFHTHFRHTWNMLYKAAESGQRPNGMSLRSYMREAEQFCSQLTVHHTIEERRIFPHLAQRMPAFREELQLLTHHKRIHEGIDKMEKYLEETRSGEKEFRMSEFKTIMDSFGAVLWEHLDAEVKELGAENMRKYWKPEEIGRIPF